MTLAFRGLDMVRAPPVPGSYLEIEALKMKLRILERAVAGRREKYSPTASHSPYART